MGDPGSIPGSLDWEDPPWRRKWQPTPVFLPGESHGRRSLVGHSPRSRRESDMTERLHFTLYVYVHILLLLFLWRTLPDTAILQDKNSNPGFPGGSVVNNPPANAGNRGSIPGLGRSPGGGNGNLLQYSCLENPMDREVHGIIKELDTT